MSRIRAVSIILDDESVLHFNSHLLYTILQARDADSHNHVDLIKAIRTKFELSLFDAKHIADTLLAASTLAEPMAATTYDQLMELQWRQ